MTAWQVVRRLKPAALGVAVAACAVLAFGAASTVSAAAAPRAVGAAAIPASKPPITIPTKSLLPAAPQWCADDAVAPSPGGFVWLCWVDNSTNEQDFVVYKVDATGAWQQTAQYETKNEGGVGGQSYEWEDVPGSSWNHLEAVESPEYQGPGTPDPNVTHNGWCYKVAAVNQFGATYSPEQCTVVPNPEWFPQNVSPAVKQWNGLSGVNGGTGDLFNRPRGHSLVNAHQTFGVDLDWSSKPALWKIQALGGSPQIMYGQAVAIRVWGGGWLTYGHQTFGVGLSLSQTPSYEWYVLGGQPGTPVDSRPAYQALEFALWNSRAKTYLVTRHQTFGVSLDWYQKDTSFGTVHLTKVLLNALPPVGNAAAYVGSFGGGSAANSVLNAVSFYGGPTPCSSGGFNGSCGPPNPGVPPLAFPIGGGTGSQTCASRPSALETLGWTDFSQLWGRGMTPSLAQPLRFFACSYDSGNPTQIPVWVQYIDQ